MTTQQTPTGSSPAATDPPTMRVSVMDHPGAGSVQRRPVPQPAIGEVLIRVAAVGVCGSDVHWFQHGRIGDTRVTAPLVLGHEASGRITAVGAGVDPGRIGQKVAIEPGFPCRRCAQCSAGRYNLCPDVRFYATPPIDGAFAEYVVAPADFAHTVPDSISDEAAALIEPLAVAVWACRKAAVTAGDRVLITGAGPIGAMTAQTARAFGATAVVVADINPARLAAAPRYGATGTVDIRTGDLAVGAGLVEAFIDCSGAEPAIRQGITAVRPAGRVVLVGMGGADITLPLGLIQSRELTVTGTFRYANAYPNAIALAAAGLVDLDGMVTNRVGLDDVPAALTPGADPAAMKTIVLPTR